MANVIDPSNYRRTRGALAVFVRDNPDGDPTPLQRKHRVERLALDVLTATLVSPALTADDLDALAAYVATLRDNAA